MGMIILAALILDLIFGDPRWFPHPVVIMGNIISWGETAIRKSVKSPGALKAAGALLAVALITGSYAFFWAVIYLAYHYNTTIGLLLSIIIMSQTLSVNSLYQHAMAVFRPLASGDLALAREKLSMIVGRDTNDLDEAQIVRGVVETVAENTVDGIISPMFYGLIGGPALAMAYKATNTLDSMVGYKNERFYYLGWASARLDDIANYIPARLAALLFLIIAPFTTGGLRQVWQTLLRDASKHPSPNSGLPEAAVAGAMGVQLGGQNSYYGVLEFRAIIGSPDHPLVKAHIRTTLVLMLAVTIEMMGLIVLTGR